MIKLNGKVIEQSRFPDNTLLIKCIDTPSFIKGFNNDLEWYYEDDSELFSIICIAMHYWNNRTMLNLIMPYVPHARMDRVKNKEDVFTLKYFCNIINTLHFSSVKILDPHSDVTPALLNNVIVLSPEKYIHKTLDDISKNDDEPLIFFPDNGASKRYGSMVNMPYTYGVKNRDWNTGEIKSLDVANADMVKDRNILIIDDICSKGGTFYYSAKRLKELGAKNIYLYITHCENSIFDGQIFTSRLIKRVYTTNSLLKLNEENDNGLIEVIKL